MNISEALVQGNTFSEFDEIFFKEGFKNLDLNMNIVQIIDFTICNAGSITAKEVKKVKKSLTEIKAQALDSKYKALISDVISKIQNYIPSELDGLCKSLII